MMLRKLISSNKLKNFIDVVIIAFLSIIPIRLTLNDENLIVVQDFGFPLHIVSPSFAFYGWNHKSLTGVNNMLLSFNWLPYHFTLFFLNSFFNVPLWILNRLVIVASFFFLGLGIYFLLRVCGRSRPASLIAAFFAMFNPTVATRDSYGQMTLLIQAGFIPIVLGLYLWMKDKKFSALNIAILTSLASLPIMILANPVEIGFLAFCFIALMVVEVLYNPKEVLNNIKILVLYSVVSFLINSWWLVPGLYFIFYSKGQFYTVKETYAPYVQMWISSMSSIIKAFQLHTLDATSRFTFYSNPIIQLLGLFLFSFAIFFSVLKKDKLNSFSLTVLAVAVVLFQGVSPPFGKLYEFLYNNFPGFFIYREVNHFDSLLLISISSLLGSSFDVLILKFKNSKKIALRTMRFLLVFLASILVFVYGLPVLSGNLSRFFTPLKIPGYYFEALSYLERTNTSVRILYSSSYLTFYGWSSARCITMNIFYLDPFMPPIVNQPIAISAATLPDYARTQILNTLSSFYKLDNFSSNALGLLSIKYILTDSKDNIGDFISSKNIEGISLEKQFGSIKIYRVKNFLPLIYPTNSLTLLRSNQDLASILSFINCSYPLFVFYGQAPFSSNLTLNSRVSINWTYVSPAEYKVEVNSTGPFFLVFTETYDEGWSASSANKTYVHFVGNGYANAWFVDSKGKFEIKIEFKPNLFFYYGSTISLLSVALIIFYLLFRLAFQRLPNILKLKPVNFYKVKLFSLSCFCFSSFVRYKKIFLVNLSY